MFECGEQRDNVARVEGSHITGSLLTKEAGHAFGDEISAPESECGLEEGRGARYRCQKNSMLEHRKHNRKRHGGSKLRSAHGGKPGGGTTETSELAEGRRGKGRGKEPRGFREPYGQKFLLCLCRSTDERRQARRRFCKNGGTLIEELVLGLRATRRDDQTGRKRVRTWRSGAGCKKCIHIQCGTACAQPFDPRNHKRKERTITCAVSTCSLS